MHSTIQPLIFVIDDDIFYLKLIEQNLKSAGYTRLLCFTTGEECLNNLHLVPDIILLDYHLQETDGMNLLRRIKLHNQHAYIFLLSAQDEMEITVTCIKQGAFRYVVKDEAAFRNILQEIKLILAYEPVAKNKSKKYSNSHFVEFSSYISEYEHNEQILIDKNEQLAKLNSELDNFIYNTSHSLTSSVTSILGMIKVARLEEESFDKASFLYMMERIATRLDYTIRDMAAFSVNNQNNIIHEEIHLQELIETVFNNLASLNSLATIDKQIIIEQRAACFSDSNRLKIIFNNLLCNAIQYQDTLKSHSFIQIKVDVSPDLTSIHITDNGIGISTVYQEKVFHMFSRGTNKSKGAGLGLYIAKEVVNKLKGTINFSSVVNEGTKVTINLPNQANYLVTH